MKYRILGRTGLEVSELGFGLGCGSVGGLMVRGDHKTRVRVSGGREENTKSGKPYPGYGAMPRCWLSGAHSFLAADSS